MGRRNRRRNRRRNEESRQHFSLPESAGEIGARRRIRDFVDCMTAGVIPRDELERQLRKIPRLMDECEKENLHRSFKGYLETLIKVANGQLSMEKQQQPAKPQIHGHVIFANAEQGRLTGIAEKLGVSNVFDMPRVESGE